MIVIQEKHQGILAPQFWMFRWLFEIKVETIHEVVKVGCILHNYLR
jgi:hypothetical protein